MTKKPTEKLPKNVAAFLANLKSSEFSAATVSLAGLSDELASVVTACAIPHCFNSKVICAMFPETTMEEAGILIERMSQLSMVRSGNGSLFFHEDARRELFRKWFSKSKVNEFTTYSRRLMDYYSDPKDVDKSPYAMNQSKDSWLVMYHSIAADQNGGISNFLQEFSIERYKGHLGRCQQLLDLVDEYEGFLDNRFFGTLRYCEALLACDSRNWSLAIRKLSVIENWDDASQELLARALILRGQIALENLDFDVAIEAYLKSLPHIQNLQNSLDLEALALFGLAKTFTAKGDIKKAEECIQRGLEYVVNQSNSHLAAEGFETLGALKRKENDPLTAKGAYQRAIKIREALGEKISLARTLNDLAICHVDLNEIAEAESVLDQSLQLRRQIGDRHGEAITINNLVPIHLQNGNRSKALRGAEEASELFLATRDLFNAAVSKSNLAKLYLRDDRKEESLAQYRLACELFSQCGAEDHVLEIEQELSAIGSNCS